MANPKKTPEQKEYEKLEKKHEVKRPIWRNCLTAFWVGGLFCVVGQAITYFYIYFFNFTEKTASNPTVATMIFLSMVLTGFGIYDHIGQFAGAGSAVPVTGGFVLGVGSNMFKLAGSVILFGVFSAFVVSLVKTILSYWGG